MYIFKKSIGNRLRQLRYDKGFEQIDLEKRSEGQVKRSSISYFENGKRCPSLKSLFQLAEALSVDPAVILLDPKTNVRHRLAHEILQGDERFIQALENCLAKFKIDFDGNHPEKDQLEIVRKIFSLLPEQVT